jgi:hypothetical protein
MHGWGQTAINPDTQIVSLSKAAFQGGMRG